MQLTYVQEETKKIYSWSCKKRKEEKRGELSGPRHWTLTKRKTSWPPPEKDGPSQTHFPGDQNPDQNKKASSIHGRGGSDLRDTKKHSHFFHEKRPCVTDPKHPSLFHAKLVLSRNHRLLVRPSPVSIAQLSLHVHARFVPTFSINHAAHTHVKAYMTVPFSVRHHLDPHHSPFRQRTTPWRMALPISWLLESKNTKKANLTHDPALLT